MSAENQQTRAVPRAGSFDAHIDEVLTQVPRLADLLGGLLPKQYTAMRSVVLAVVQLIIQLATALSLTVAPGVQAAMIAEAGAVALLLLAIPALLHKWHVGAAAMVQAHAVTADATAHAAQVAALGQAAAKGPKGDPGIEPGTVAKLEAVGAQLDPAVLESLKQVPALAEGLHSVAQQVAAIPVIPPETVDTLTKVASAIQSAAPSEPITREAVDAAAAPPPPPQPPPLAS